MKRFWNKQFPAALLALLLMVSLVPAASAAYADIEKSVEAGDEVTFSRSEFRSLYNTYSDSDSSSFSYLVFTDYDDLEDYGHFTAINKSGSTVTLDEDSLENVWFYDSSTDIAYSGDCQLSGLTFVADDDAEDGTLTLEFALVGEKSQDTVDGILAIEVDGGVSSSATISYPVEAGGQVSFDAEDFYDFFEENYPSSTRSLRYVIFDRPSASAFSDGTLYYNYGRTSEEAFTRSSLSSAVFYYSDSSYGDYNLDRLTFVADKTFSDDVELTFRAYYNDSRYVDGTVEITASGKSSSSSGGDIELDVEPGDSVSFDEDDFNGYFQETYSNYDFRYLIFTDSENLNSYNGYVYYNYGRSSQVRFTASTLENAVFYYDADDMPDDDDDCYLLSKLSFVAADSFDTAVTLEFRAYYSATRYVDGSVVISPDGDTSGNTGTSTLSASILYTTTGTNVQLKASDFANFFASVAPYSTFQYVQLLGVPTTGDLYYNYYGASAYGTSAPLQLTSYNCGSQPLYLSPANTTQYALSELTYVPYGTNYCVSIPFAAYGSGGYTVYGIALVSVTSKAIPEVYGVTPKDTAVSFPAPAISSAVSAGTSSTLSGIQLLQLPDSSVGTIYVGTGTTRKAATSEQYSVSGGTWLISQLRFVPASGYTGSVEIPYIAYDSTGKIIGAGKFCLGVVNSVKKFSDVSSTTWCYKYVTELSDAGVISGYSNGTFKPDSTISYGAALKLIMLAAGYQEQAPTNSNVFSGYLAKAQADGLITRSNVDLTKPITRLQVAQLAAAALKLNLRNVSSVKPFTDTSDLYVQALYEAGIVEGYFSNGTSTFKPNNTLTRGQVSAIVWRMQNHR